MVVLNVMCYLSLTICMQGNFLYFVVSCFFLQNYFWEKSFLYYQSFKKFGFRSDPEHFVIPDLARNCLQRPSTEGIVGPKKLSS